jgi:hypothetical protein
MQHLFRDGRGVREKVDYRGGFLDAEFGDDEFGFFRDDD